MNVLLITSFSGIGFNNSPPIGLYRLKKYIEDYGFSCDVLDLSVENPDRYLNNAMRGKYKIVGTSISHMNMIADIQLMHKFRVASSGHECCFIAGGQEATYNYEQVLDAGFDAVVMGYGEFPLLEIARSIQHDGFYSAKQLSNIPGVVICDANKIKKNPAKQISESDFIDLTYNNVVLADIPFDIYWKQASYRSKALNMRSTVFVPKLARIYTSSHCPNNCGFCSSHRFLSFSQSCTAKPLMLDASSVFELVLHYADKYDAEGFLFSDDEFLVSRRRAVSFCDLIVKAKASGRLASGAMLNCQARVADFKSLNDSGAVDDEFIKLLHAAGFHSISLGVESFSDRLRATPIMNKKGFTSELAFSVIDSMLNAGITPQVNIILFIPETTRDELIYNMQCGMELFNKNCTLAVTPHLLNIPGSPCHDDNRYPSKIENYKSEFSGKIIPITNYFIPHDPLIAVAAEQYHSAFEKEVNKFYKRNKWPFEVVHKTILSVMSFVVIADSIDAKDLAHEWRMQIDKLASEFITTE